MPKTSIAKLTTIHEPHLRRRRLSATMISLTEVDRHWTVWPSDYPLCPLLQSCQTVSMVSL